MKILAIINGPKNESSTWYRLYQYKDFFEANGIELESYRRFEITPEVIKRAGEVDLVFNQKCLFSHSVSRAILRNAKRAIFDIDDAIWTRANKKYGPVTGWRVRRRLDSWLRGAGCVSVSNGYLGDYARSRGAKVVDMPMSLQLADWKPLVDRVDDGVVRIGWAGSPGNLRYIESLDGVLKRLKDDFSHLEVCIYSGKRANLSFEYTWEDYAPGTEAGFVQRLDVGLLPLTDDDFLKGKSPIKAIQYMSCGVPVVGYNQGGAKELLGADRAIEANSEDEWYEAIARLIKDAELRKQMGDRGREYVLATHDFDQCKVKLLDIFRSAIEG